MHRIDAAGFAAGNFFTDGNPSTGTPATVVDAAWLNDLQENISQVIESSGIALLKGDFTQLKSAIQQMIINGGAVKTPVRVATTANLASLAGGASNALDGVSLTANDRILVKDQATASQNGIYVVTTLGTGANGTWSRAGDADAASELVAGLLVVVSEGVSQADTLWELATDGAITLGSTLLAFARKDSGQGNFSGLNSTNVSAILSQSDMGRLYVFYGSTASQTLTLPAVATVMQGKTAVIVNQASVAVTVKGNALESISGNTAGAGQTLSNTITLSPGDSIILCSNGNNQWISVGFTSSGQFPNSLAINGYQKLPNGLIIQWGVTGAVGAGLNVSFPIAFPNACRSVVAAPNTATAGVTLSTQSWTTTQFNVSYIGNNLSSTATWFAIGN